MDIYKPFYGAYKFNIIAHTVHLMSASGMSIDYKRLLKIYLNSCLVML